ncbi:MAG: hypothetical protein ACRC2U_07910 [Aeromonas sp.]
MQQSTLLLDISDLPPIEILDAEDIQQLTACIELCRSNDRPDLAAPYAMLLCEYYNHYNETENSLWFDAISNDDIFLVKALVAAGFNINTIININRPGDEWCGAAIHSALENQSEQCIAFLLQQPDLNIDIVGSTYIETEGCKCNSETQARYTIPLLGLYHSPYRVLLSDICFDVDIRWGNGWQFNPLQTAIDALDVDFIKWLLDKRANPNIDLLFNGMTQETPLGILASWYFHEPSDVKLKLLITMAHCGGSTRIECDDGYSLGYKILQSKNEPLISAFGLDDIQGLIEAQTADLELFAEHAKDHYVKPHLRMASDPDYYHTPSLKISILNELRIKGNFVPGRWVTELALIQQDEEIGIHIEQQESQIAAITIFLPAEVSSLPNPFTSSLAMGYHFIQCPLNWWHEVERYLRRYHITLIDPDFFEARREELEAGY